MIKRPENVFMNTPCISNRYELRSCSAADHSTPLSTRIVTDETIEQLETEFETSLDEQLSSSLEINQSDEQNPKNAQFNYENENRNAKVAKVVGDRVNIFLISSK